MKYLVVDNDIKLAESEAAVWARRGIKMERTGSMMEGIKRLMSDDYLFVGINDDAVDFMPMLSAMRVVTATPILVATSNFTTEAEVAAMSNGANLFARWHGTPEANMKSVMAHVANCNQRLNAKPQLLVCGNMLVLSEHKMVFCNDKEVTLTAKEYGLLVYMLNHRNITLTKDQIIREVWNESIVTDATIRKTIDMLRKVLYKAEFNGGSIINFRGMGYRLSTKSR